MQELNLQTLRRSLIQMIDDFEAADCSRCKLIKCRCEPNGPTPPQSLTGSIPSQTGLPESGRNDPISPRSFAEAVGGQDLKSPPAGDLPRPDFKTSSESNEQPQPQKDVEAWVRASTPNPDKTDSPGSKPYADLWPSSAPKSVWNEYKNKINRPEINTATVCLQICLQCNINQSSCKIVMHRLTDHALLEPPSPAYTNVTVRRAFIVWLHCGQTNKFKDVCNYFHFLEGLEDKLPVENRAVSRRHEFDLFTNPPPSSTYLNSHHPKLYTNTQLENYYVTKLEAIRNEKCVFKLEGFEEIGPKNGATKQQIVQTSQLIRNYCLSHSITLKKFLLEFKTYAAKCQLKNSVQNVASYIKRKMVKEELTMIANCPRTFSFLEEDVVNMPASLNSQMRLLDSIKLSPMMKLNGADVWSNEHLKNKVLNARKAFAKKSSNNRNINTTQNVNSNLVNQEATKYGAAYIDVLRQKFKNELMVS